MRPVHTVASAPLFVSAACFATPPENSPRVTDTVRIIRKTEPAVAAVFSQAEGRLSMGSGRVVHKDGYILTNDHVVAGERQISVTQFKGSGAELTKRNFDNVRIVATGGNLDLALLKIEGISASFKFPFVRLGASPNLKQGERVFAIGSPLGLERSVSEGIVSLRNRIISDRLHIQTTAEISPGNSGGPLFNYKGEVVGVNNMKVVAQGAEGLGFAIPVDSLKTFLLNRDAYAFDPRNPNAGFRYTDPPRSK